MTSSNYNHRNPSLSPSERADLLAAEMTLREKCHQLTAVPAWSFVNADGSEAKGIEEVLGRSPGHIINVALDDPKALAELTGQLQRHAVTGTRLGIPLLIHAEALNGFMSGGHMVFPTGTGLAATWSPDLVEEMADLIRRQMRRTGVRQALSPVMDVALDPRWGRFHETYGEDPYLCAALSVAYTRGLQGEDIKDGVIATAKHFLGYGLAEGGINLSAFEAGARRTRDLFAYPFEAAIQMAGLRSVMNSYADVDGVPAGMSREILTDLLRGTLGFDGFVSSDYGTTDQMVHRQLSASSPAEAGRMAIRAGLDVELPTAFGFGDVLAGEVEAGRVDVAHVDLSVRRVLRAKFELGLFEDPYPAETISVSATAAEGQELSKELARRAVVLVKNNGVLPLDPRAVKVAAIGPHADTAALQFPTYTYPAFREMTLVMSSGGLGNMIGVDPGMTAWNSAQLPAAETEDFVRERYRATALSDEIARFTQSVLVQRGSSLTHDLSDKDLAKAVRAAEDADVAVLALGGASLWFNGERTEGEASDSAEIALPAAQTRLVQAVAATGTPMVVVVFQGRPYVLPECVQNAAAIIVAPFGGPYGPKAVAEAVFGEFNPSGKLPYSIPRHVGQIPVYHHQKAGTGYRNPVPPAVSQHYLDMEATPLYTFGHGLSYTDFKLSDPAFDEEVDTFGEMKISAHLTNTGGRNGAATVQLYVRVNTTGVTRPAQQLIGFARIELAEGESQRVQFTLDATLFGYTNMARDFAVEPAKVDFFMGLNSAEKSLEGSFQIVGEARVLASADRSFLAPVAISHAAPASSLPAAGSDDGINDG